MLGGVPIDLGLVQAGVRCKVSELVTEFIEVVQRCSHLTEVEFGSQNLSSFHRLPNNVRIQSTAVEWTALWQILKRTIPIGVCC